MLLPWILRRKETEEEMSLNSEEEGGGESTCVARSREEAEGEAARKDSFA